MRYKGRLRGQAKAATMYSYGDISCLLDGVVSGVYRTHDATILGTEDVGRCRNLDSFGTGELLVSVIARSLPPLKKRSPPETL